MEKLVQFVAEHIDDDIGRLILDRKKWPDIDIDTAVNCIESRRKLRGKVQEWYDEPRLVFPLKLSAEQCSSSATARYKADLAAHIAGTPSWRIADLTGGLGVDTWFFSLRADAVLYNEMRKPLCDAARHNFSVLGADNIDISNRAAVPEKSLHDPECRFSDGGQDAEAGSPAMLLKDFRPDIVYMDPARRGEGGRKVFLIEECTPDVLTLKDEIFRYSRHILLKLSPMADITMACDRLGKNCREVHVVSAGGECKELLIWMDREWEGEYMITAVEIRNEKDVATFLFHPSEEKSPDSQALSAPKLTSYPAGQDHPCYLFEPGKAMMKAGGFNLMARRFNLGKLGRSTHYYTTESSEHLATLRSLGKVFRIMSCHLLDKRSLKAAGKEYPHSEVTARNIPMDTDTLRKKMGVTSGDDAHIFGLKSDAEGNILIVGQRI